MTEQSVTMPQRISFDRWADIGFKWQGVVPVSAFERLSSQIHVANSKDLQITLHLAKDEDIAWLSFDVKAVLSVSCQRCLDELSVDVSGSYRMAILENEHKISYLQSIDETADYVLLDEVCMGVQKMLPVADLLEDELLLAMPLSPRHDDCQMLIENADEKGEPSDNPFAVLQTLKGTL